MMVTVMVMVRMVMVVVTGDGNDGGYGEDVIDGCDE